jgi:TRAP-type transport system periplasmic protein
MKLTIAGAPPPTVTPVRVAKEYFVPEVNRRLAASGNPFRIEWTEAYSQTLVKFTETLEAVEEGVAHVGVLLKNFEESKLPLEQYVAMMPFGTGDTAKQLEIDAKVRARVPEMDATFDKYNQIALSHAPSESMQMFTKFPLKKVEDLQGKKIGASGALGQVLRGTGAVIVTSSMLSSFTDIKAGVYDGYPISASLAFPYKTYQAAPHMAEVDFGTTMVAAITVNKKTWAALPAHAQKIFREVAHDYVLKYMALEKERSKQVLEQIRKEGVDVVVFSPEQRRAWAMKMPNIAREWALQLDKEGQPGTKLLAAYMEESRAAGVKLMRNWDKE